MSEARAFTGEGCATPAPATSTKQALSKYFIDRLRIGTARGYALPARCAMPATGYVGPHVQPDEDGPEFGAVLKRTTYRWAEIRPIGVFPLTLHRGRWFS
jgi:hypothetical protein